MTDKQPITVEDLYKMVSVEDPRISPDGRWIAYIQVNVDKMDNGYKRNLWLVSTDGNEPIQITRSGKDLQPRWSPDGTTLAFTSGRDDKPQIYLLRIVEPGGEPRSLTSLPNGASSPEWSPDGKTIAFLGGMNAEERAKEDGGEEEDAPIDKLDAKHRKERHEQDETKRWDPRIIERIPYRTGTSFISDHFEQIYVVPTIEGLEKDEAKPRRLTNEDVDHEPPQWTPDGQYVLTARTIDAERDEPWLWSGLYRIWVEDGKHEQLTDESFASFSPISSPDGNWIAYIRLPRENIHERLARLTVMPTDGGDLRDLNLEFNRSVGDFKWIPNSSGILLTGLSEGNTEIYSVSLGDGEIEKVVAGRIEILQLDVDDDAGIAYTACTPMSSPELFWQDSSVDKSAQMTYINQKFLEGVIVQEVHEMRWTAPSGTEI